MRPCRVIVFRRAVLAACGVLGAAGAAGFNAVWAADGDVRGQGFAGGKPAANAVVWLDAPNAPKTAQHGTVVLDQRNLTFYPHVLAVRVGTTVDFPNHDRVFHNVFSFRDGKRFDLGLYPAGEVRHITFAKPGLSRLFCNIHPGMSAYVMSVDTPFFAVSDNKGRFALSNVPAGNYSYHAWHPGGTELHGSVVVRSGTSIEIRWP